MNYTKQQRDEMRRDLSIYGTSGLVDETGFSKLLDDLDAAEEAMQVVAWLKAEGKNQRPCSKCSHFVSLGEGSRLGRCFVYGDLPVGRSVFASCGKFAAASKETT